MSYYLVMPSSKVYISGFGEFIHAYHEWHAMPESARAVWFIVNDEHPLMVRGLSVEWLKLRNANRWPAKRWDNRHKTRTNRGPWVRGRKVTTCVR